MTHQDASALPTVAVGVLARRPGDLGVRWAQRVADEAAPGTTVHRVELLESSSGTSTRVRLAVAHDGPLPERWFVKLPPRSWKARAIIGLAGLSRTEVRFYRTVATAIAVERPTALAAAGGPRGGFTLVLADLAEGGAVAGTAGEVLSAERAQAVVALLAALHAPLWEHPRLAGDLAWMGGPVRRLEDRLGAALALPLMRRGLERAGDAVPARLRAPALAYARRRRQAMRELAEGPRTVVHHDCHPGNLYWRGAAPGLLDWQLARIGEGVGDVAYLLATGLEPDARRASEHALLAHYAAALADHGVRAGGLEERYRVHLAYAFEAMVVTLAIGGLMPEGAALAMVRRAARAADELAAFEALSR